MSGRRPRALPPENKQKPKEVTGKVRGPQARIAPRDGGEAHIDEHQKEHFAERKNEEGEVRASTDATAPWLGKSVDELHVDIDRRGIDPKLILSILTTATRMFAPEETLPIESLERLAVEAIASSDGNYGVKEAVKWAEGYEFPQDLVDSDLRLFRASQLDFTTMVKRRLKKIGANRLSSHRVEQLRLDNPERVRLFDIAKGMRAPIPEGFISNAKGLLTPLRPAYLDVHQAVDKMLGDLHAQGLAFCLPKKEAIELIDGLHLSKASWTPKKGKASGRSIGDMSFCDGTPLNGDESKLIAESWWGKIELPTIEEVVIMILDFYRAAILKDPTVKWEDLRLWKTDLRGAYQLLSLHPDFAKYFGMEIFGDRVYIHLCGIFGWTCTPAAFQVVSRAIQLELGH